MYSRKSKRHTHSIWSSVEIFSAYDIWTGQEQIIVKSCPITQYENGVNALTNTNLIKQSGKQCLQERAEYLLGWWLV